MVLVSIYDETWIYVGQLARPKSKGGGEWARFFCVSRRADSIWRAEFRDELKLVFKNLPEDLKYGTVEETGWGEYELKRQMHLGKPIMQEHCRIETNRNCGCGFGQCARGLIY
jgi:hypothetical protein